MSEVVGTIRMKRNWREHPAFSGEAYSRMDAWGWIVENALWKDGVVSVNGSPRPLMRGQLSYSIRFLADKFKWGKSSVARFLKHLQKWDMVQYETGTGQVVITVCNYNRYQLSPGYGRDTVGTEKDTQAGQERDTSGTKKNEGNEGNEIRTPPTPPGGDGVGAHPAQPKQGRRRGRGKNADYTPEFEVFWQAWNPSEGMTAGNKRPAFERYQQALESTTAERLLAAAGAYCRDCARRKARTQHVATWLYQGGWETAGEARENDCVSKHWYSLAEL
jgi:hypothetical protein